MNSFMDFLGRHNVWDTVVIFWIISAAVGALPEPAPDGHGLYRWLYTFLTTLVGRLDDAIMQRRAANQSSASKEAQ